MSPVLKPGVSCKIENSINDSQTFFHSFYLCNCKEYSKTLKILDDLREKLEIVLKLEREKALSQIYLEQIKMIKELLEGEEFGQFRIGYKTLYQHILLFLQALDHYTDHRRQACDTSHGIEIIKPIDEITEGYRKIFEDFSVLELNLRVSGINTQCQRVINELLYVTNDSSEDFIAVKNLWDRQDKSTIARLSLSKKQRTECVAVQYYKKFVQLHTIINEAKVKAWRKMSWVKRILSYIYPVGIEELKAQENRLSIIYAFAETLSNRLRSVPTTWWESFCRLWKSKEYVFHENLAIIRDSQLADFQLMQSIKQQRVDLIDKFLSNQPCTWKGIDKTFNQQMDKLRKIQEKINSFPSITYLKMAINSTKSKQQQYAKEIDRLYGLIEQTEQNEFNQVKQICQIVISSSQIDLKSMVIMLAQCRNFLFDYAHQERQIFAANFIMKAIEAYWVYQANVNISENNIKDTMKLLLLNIFIRTSKLITLAKKCHLMPNNEVSMVWSSLDQIFNRQNNQSLEFSHSTIKLMPC